MAADGSYIPANVSRESWIVGTPEYLAMMRLRKIWAEGSFSVLKQGNPFLKGSKKGAFFDAGKTPPLPPLPLNKRWKIPPFFSSSFFFFFGTFVGVAGFFFFVKRI